jgi:hypothetical protein
MEFEISQAQKVTHYVLHSLWKYKVDLKKVKSRIVVIKSQEENGKRQAWENLVTWYKMIFGSE